MGVKTSKCNINNTSKHRGASSASLAADLDSLPCSCGDRSWSYVNMGHSLLTKKCKVFFPTWIQIILFKKLFIFHCYHDYLKGASFFAMVCCSELKPF